MEAYRQRVKLVPCPHCRRVGGLNAHGFLRGYAERGQARIVRGRRFFCSNRHHRPGCGRTFSVLLCRLLRGFVVGTETLRQFVDAVCRGMTRGRAWATCGTLSPGAGYRLWRRFCRAGPHLRTCLLRCAEPPPSRDTEPISQLLSHMRHVLVDVECLFTAFQRRFDIGLMG